MPEAPRSASRFPIPASWTASSSRAWNASFLAEHPAGTNAPGDFSLRVGAREGLMVRVQRPRPRAPLVDNRARPPPAANSSVKRSHYELARLRADATSPGGACGSPAWAASQSGAVTTCCRHAQVDRVRAPSGRLVRPEGLVQMVWHSRRAAVSERPTSASANCPGVWGRGHVGCPRRGPPQTQDPRFAPHRRSGDGRSRHREARGIPTFLPDQPGPISRARPAGLRTVPRPERSRPPEPGVGLRGTARPPWGVSGR